MPKPAISVAMSVYNGERFLPLAIESVLAQSFTDFELLILDDGSSDASAEIIMRYAAADTRIRPVFRENRGLIVSLNELLDLAQAPLVARMDADDICRPDRFARQVEFLARHADYGVVGSWSEDIGEHGEALARDGADHPLTHEDMLVAIENGEQLICHPAVMYRREVVHSVGGYHAAFRHCEDLDLWLRLSNVTRMGNIPERLLRYRRYSDQVSARHSTEQQIGSVIARLAWQERRDGRRDPTEHLARLPAIDELDRLFGRPGLSRTARESIALSLRWSPAAMRDKGFDILLDHVRGGGRRDGLWRTVARLLRFGEPLRALRLAAALARN